VDYAFQFNVVWDNFPQLLNGAWLTVQLTAMSMAIGLGVAVVCAYAKSAGPGPARCLAVGYVELIRNTPFLVQIFIFYFSLPLIGIHISANAAALGAMTINFGAYAAEIIRSGIEAVPRGQIEAGRALGLSRLQIFGLIIAFQALKIIWPALSSQITLLLLSSSIVSTISAVELTAVTNSMQSKTFRAFEFYFVSTGLYLAMSLFISSSLSAVYWAVFQRGREK
jgi:polar amino acid transport system permease protein